MCHNEGSEITVRIQIRVNKSKAMIFYEKFRYIFCRKLNFEQMCNHQGSGKFCIFMKNFAGKFFVANRIWNECVTMRSRKKPFEFSFWLISWNLWTFMNNFVTEFFVENWILNKYVTTRGWKKLFKFSFFSLYIKIISARK